jgi:hypothetical protein
MSSVAFKVGRARAALRRTNGGRIRRYLRAYVFNGGPMVRPVPDSVKIAAAYGAFRRLQEPTTRDHINAVGDAAALQDDRP